MHQVNFALLQEEALRLINIESQFLSEMLDVTGLVLKEQKENKQTFDQTSVKKTVEILDGESKKLAKQELVLAVVGTMKAGKSTTINAIVGTEILPNRNRPMTALPTLIRHKPRQKEPVLRLQNNQPLNKYLQRLQGVLSKKSVDASAFGAEDQADMKKLIENIKYIKSFKTEIHGKRGIYDFLKMLNDLVRLSVVTKTPFPFTHYNKVDELPVIEVEFAHLEQYQSQVGQLTLLDTPGPNEAGQEQLKPMLTDQLKKASAILTVLDYTQLKSDADATVRKELQDIADECQDRLFVLVNKFDQKDRNADSADQVKNYVADHLMAGVIDAQVVYPVSANLAYLASRAQTEIELHDKLDISQSWVEDFGKFAFGKDWQDDIHNSDQVLEKAVKIWNKAGFATPLQEVLCQLNQKSAISSLDDLDSTAIKIRNIIQDIRILLEIREKNIKTSIKNLEKQAELIEKNIDELDDLQKLIPDFFYHPANLESQCLSLLESMKLDLFNKVSACFESTNVKKLLDKSGLSSDFISGDVGFKDEQTAVKFQKSLVRELDELILNNMTNFHAQLTRELKGFSLGLNEQIDVFFQMKAIGDKYKSNHKIRHFKVRVPDVSNIMNYNLWSGLKLTSGQLISYGIIGIFGSLLFSPPKNDFPYRLSITSYKDSIDDCLKEKFDDFQQDITVTMLNYVKKEIMKLNANLINVVATNRNDLRKNIDVHKKSQEEQEQLLLKLAAFMKHADDIRIDSLGLVADIKQRLVLDSSEATATLGV
ncbi:dynamin family protein [Vibrio metschnikovii]|uniref:dynamin family protein n=1 Tax=Vibrio metschnikovii TaxID=28172 RepID=UPI001C305EB4|nr:dynamin family protein [Vibrio metschnikovii]